MNLQFFDWIVRLQQAVWNLNRYILRILKVRTTVYFEVELFISKPAISLLPSGIPTPTRPKNAATPKHLKRFLCYLCVLHLRQHSLWCSIWAAALQFQLCDWPQIHLRSYWQQTLLDESTLLPVLIWQRLEIGKLNYFHHMTYFDVNRDNTYNSLIMQFQIFFYKDPLYSWGNYSTSSLILT